MELASVIDTSQFAKIDGSRNFTGAQTFESGVVVNENGGSASADAFRVESSTNTHAIYVDPTGSFVYFGGTGATSKGRLQFATGRLQMLGGIVGNEDGGSASSDDSRFESDTNTHAVFVDASANKVFFGGTTETGSGLVVDVANDIAKCYGATNADQLRIGKGEGSSEYYKIGRDNASTGYLYHAAQQENFNGYRWLVFPSGGSIDTTALTIHTDGGVVGAAATGGSQGLGTANFTGVYDDGSLLSDYVFDAAINGSIDTAKYDAQVPDRETPERVEERTLLETVPGRFVERLEFEGAGDQRRARLVREPHTRPQVMAVPVIDEEGEPVLDEDGAQRVVYERLTERVVRPAKTEVRTHEPARNFDLAELDPAVFRAKWMASRKLPAFARLGGNPSLGEHAQALLETCEVQAVHIARLEDRLSALEGLL